MRVFKQLVADIMKMFILVQISSYFLPLQTLQREAKCASDWYNWNLYLLRLLILISFSSSSTHAFCTNWHRMRCSQTNKKDWIQCKPTKQSSVLNSAIKHVLPISVNLPQMKQSFENILKAYCAKVSRLQHNIRIFSFQAKQTRNLFHKCVHWET